MDNEYHVKIGNLWRAYLGLSLPWIIFFIAAVKVEHNSINIEMVLPRIYGNPIIYILGLVAFSIMFFRYYPIAFAAIKSLGRLISINKHRIYIYDRWKVEASEVKCFSSPKFNPFYQTDIMMKSGKRWRIYSMFISSNPRNDVANLNDILSKFSPRCGD